MDGLDCTITFTPHLIPMTRGILATIYLTPNHTIGTADACKCWRGFIKVVRLCMYCHQEVCPIRRRYLVRIIASWARLSMAGLAG